MAASNRRSASVARGHQRRRAGPRLFTPAEAALHGPRPRREHRHLFRARVRREKARRIAASRAQPSVPGPGHRAPPGDATVRSRPTRRSRLCSFPPRLRIDLDHAPSVPRQPRVVSATSMPYNKGRVGGACRRLPLNRAGRRPHIPVMQTTNDIRAAFLDYFARHDHEVVRVEPAGAAQRPDPAVHQRRHGAVQERLHRRREAALSARRHLAEMRARRRQAQRPRKRRLHRAASHVFRDARQFLVRRLLQGPGDRAGLEPGRRASSACNRDRLLVTVYAEDDDAARLWAKIAGLPEQRIIRIATSDNFWAMGDTGPCGPCSEIFYDHGEDIPGGPPGSPDEDGDRFIEIWNLVFMQFEQLPGERRGVAAAVDRYRHGAGAHRRGAAGQARQLRHRPVPRA